MSICFIYHISKLGLVPIGVRISEVLPCGLKIRHHVVGSGYVCICPPLDLESKLRKLRQTSANLEEENALLSRHVENMKVAVEKAQNEVKKQEEKNESLQSHLGVLREVLAASFKDLPLPGETEI